MAGRSFTRHSNGVGNRIRAEHINELQAALESDDSRIDAKAGVDELPALVDAAVADTPAITSLTPGPGEVIVGTASGPVATTPRGIVDAGQGEPGARVMTLLSGQDDEAYVRSSCTTAADTTNYRVGDRGLAITTTGAVTATARWDGGPISMPEGVCAVSTWFYVPTPALVSRIDVELYMTSDSSIKWIRSTGNLSAPIVTGWNRFRWAAHETTRGTWDTIHRVRFTVVTTAGTTVTMGQLALESRPKASLVFIEDSGYKTFHTSGYPDLVQRGIPVTWSLDPAILGTGTGDAARMTEADVMAAAANGNGDSFGFHGYDGAATATMTAAEIRADTVKAQKWLSARGFTGGMWRSAWVQNTAENASAANSLLVAGATSTNSNGYETWPPRNRYGIVRYALHGRTNAEYDTMFATLEETHQVLFGYTHGISGTEPFQMTPEQWGYFLAKVDQGKSEGWLECVTFETLMARSGARWRQGLGEMVYEYTDETGAFRQYRPV